MEITRIFGLFIGQLDLGASLLFGLPLLVIGLTLAWPGARRSCPLAARRVRYADMSRISTRRVL